MFCNYKVSPCLRSESNTSLFFSVYQIKKRTLYKSDTKVSGHKFVPQTKTALMITGILITFKCQQATGNRPTPYLATNVPSNIISVCAELALFELAIPKLVRRIF